MNRSPVCVRNVKRDPWLDKAEKSITSLPVMGLLDGGPAVIKGPVDEPSRRQQNDPFIPCPERYISLSGNPTPVTSLRH